jgi:hypothetical protein
MRLFIDHKTTEGWRGIGFQSILNGLDKNNSLLENVLEQKNYPDPELLPAEESNVCYKDKKMFYGMPYGLSALEPQQIDKIQDWLKKGAQPPSQDELRLDQVLQR